MTIYINHENKCLVNGKTGEIVFPTCWDDLIAYHAYLTSRGLEAAAKGLLKDVISGNKVMSDMINGFNQHWILDN